MPGRFHGKTTLSDVDVRCVKCGLQTNIPFAEVYFEKSVFNLLINAGISRQQSRQFQRIVKKSADLDWIVERTQTIDQNLHHVAKLAKKEKDPYRALKVVAVIATFLAGAAPFILSYDDVWDRYHNGELFESPPSQQSGDLQKHPDRKRRDDTTKKRSGGSNTGEPIDDGIDI